MTTVEGKLAALVDESRVAINLGSAAGVQEGDRVSLFRTVQVDDPDSGESLGSVEVKKLALKVELVREKMCVAAVSDLFIVDNEAGDTLSALLRPKRRKRVAFDVARGDQRTVKVAIGERVTIDISRDVDSE
ncbi:FlgT C-terminal domain-containing protein [Streptomyces sp. PTY087I2]|uniref:FlgT C-terminal domain-containing protein n=1 Tax=Streptomyces sp. PTY087I2 TaxID=1819298 RepID=UPI00099FC2CB|nr:FlgT C-terminal domain-containing protein [Streptomyces sp. PTY087I2]